MFNNDPVMTRQPLTVIELKKINQKNVYDYIYKVKTTSKLEIANSLKISLPTVASSVNSLISQGLVSNCGEYDSTGGRKAQIFCCDGLARISIGVEVLKEGVQIVAIDLYGVILKEAYYDKQFENVEEYYSELGKWINGFVAGLPYSRERNLGVCIALQGLISDDGETITYSEILKSTGVKRSTYQKYIDYPCTLVHDTEAAALAETWQQHEISDAVYIALNRNFGGTLILDGRIQHSVGIQSGVIEHMVLDPNGPVCYCGNHGCIETYCSANSLKKAANMELSKFFELVHDGDFECNTIWNRYLHYLALAINNIRMVINCSFIIGGYMLQFINDSDIESLTDLINKNYPFKDYRTVELKLSRNGDKSPKLGAAISLVNSFIAEI